MKNGRISTGIYGLNDLMDGGFRENTINIIRGGTGVGKTTFALQFSLFGLNKGEKVTYVSFEMSEEQIIRDCTDLGWGIIKDYIKDGSLKVIQLFGEDLTFPSLDIVEMVKKSITVSNPRIVIDPLTYSTFYFEKENRKSLSTIFQELRKMGTALIVLEEPVNGDLAGSEMPLHLADTVIHLQKLDFGETYDRTLRIMKHRGSKHGEGLYPYSIENGLGIVLQASEKQMNQIRPKTKFDEQFEKAIEKTKSMRAMGKTLSFKIRLCRRIGHEMKIPPKYLRLF